MIHIELHIQLQQLLLPSYSVLRFYSAQPRIDIREDVLMK